MALYAFDGTGNKDRKKSGRDSNVLKFFEVYEQAFPDQGNTYITGIGSGHLVGIRSFNKITGHTGKKKVKEGMKALEENLREGRTEIDVVGFSRGAAEALQFANNIHQNEIEGEKGRPIRFLGLWDTVASFGNPANHREPNWDLGLPKNVESFCHALALDERRQFFVPTRQAETNAFAARSRKVREVWFRGCHSDVGGGNDNVGLSSIPLVWMLRRAFESGVEISPDLYEKYRLLCNAGAKAKRPKDLKESPTRTITPHDVVHISVSNIPADPSRKRFQAHNPPEGIRVAGYEGKIMPERYTMG